MDLAEYVQSDETVAAQAETERRFDGSGQLVATDSRLVFYQSNFLIDRIRDIPLDRVDQVEYRVHLLSPLFSFLAMLSLAAAFIISESPQPIPSELSLSGSIIFAVISVALLLLAWHAPSERLVVETPSASHTFKGGSLSEIPDAIRDYR